MPRWNGSLSFPLFVVVLTLCGLVFGCDVPTGTPAVNTNTNLNASLLTEKTYSFLGGAAETRTSLIDTTRAGTDALFTTEPGTQTVLVEQSVQKLGTGTLNGILDEAARELEVDTSFAGSVVTDNDIRTQPVEAAVRHSHGPFAVPERTTSMVVPPAEEGTQTVPFPIGAMVPPPHTPVVDARGTSVTAAVLTGASDNRIAFTLENRQSRGTPLTNGTPGEAPTIALHTADGQQVLSRTGFGDTPIGPGERRTVVADVSGAELGTETTLVLQVAHHDSGDRLTVDTRSGLQAKAVTLAEGKQVEMRMAATGVEVPEPSSSRFAGVYVASGTLTLRVENGFSFPLTINRFALSNNDEARALLPSSFPALGVTLGRASMRAEAEGAAEHAVSLAGVGVAQTVDVTVQGTPATDGPVTLRTDDYVRVGGTGAPVISKMHFWPSGETVHSGGTLRLQQDQVDFERVDDFVEIESGTLRLQKLQNKLDVGFESLVISYPDIRRPDADGDGRRYAAGDSLEVRFVANPDGPYEFAPIERASSRRQEVSVQALRFLPQGNTLDFHMTGTLHTVERTTKEQLRVLRVRDEIHTSMRILDLNVRAVRARIRPFAVDVTADANADGRLDVASAAEVQQVSFQDIEQIAHRVDGLQLRGGTFNLSVETNVGTDVRLYGALRGEGREGTSFLRGRGPNRVSSSNPVASRFVNGGTPLGAEKLFRVDIAEGPPGTSVTRTTAITEQNATVNDFLSALPTRLRFAGTAMIQSGRVDVRAPVRLGVGVGVNIPLSFAGGFTYRDTLDADLSGLDPLTDPDQTVSMSSARLQVNYANRIPLGFEATLSVLDEDGRQTMVLPQHENTLDVEAAPRTADGTREKERTGTITIDLSRDQVQTLARGRRIGLQLRVKQPAKGPPVHVRADDAIRLTLGTDIDASVQVGG